MGSDANDLRKRKVKKKVAFVIPDEGRSESATVAHCKQARLYLDDVRGGQSSEIGSGGGSTPKTLLECYKASYTSSSTHATFNVANNTHHDSPVLLDPTMTLNYLARLSPSFVRESRAEAHSGCRG